MIDKKISKFYGRMMINLAKQLYPINRSITGEGVRKTLDLIKSKIPLQKKYFKSGKRVLTGLFQKNGILKKHIY